MKKEIKKAPTIRFRGFTGDWEQRKLGEVVKEVTRTDPNSTAPIMMITANDGFINQSERYSTDNAGQSLKKYITLKKGELAYNHGASKLRPYGSCFSLTAEENARIPFVYHCFSTETENPEFLSTVLNGKPVERQLRKLVSSGARMDGLLNISFEDYVSILVMLPRRKEQDKIADYFRNLDKAITLHQRKFDELKTAKKFFLQNMFPAKGEKVPRIRFQGFTGDWEQRKLEELGKARSGIGFPNNEQGGKDGIPFYKVSDMNNVGNEHEMITANNYVTREQIARKGWNVIEEVPAIFFAKVGAAVLLNRKRLCRFPFLLDNNTMAYSIDRYVLDTDFAKALFETIDLTSLIQVGALPSYNAGDIENMNVVIPKINEQRKIGTYLHNLDNLITLHQRKLDQLKTLKKFMLQNLFI